MTTRRLLVAATTVAGCLVPALVLAQAFPAAAPPAEAASDMASQWTDVVAAVTRLPLATALASLLALRPRRKGTPERNLAVIHTQIILAVVGALVMLVVGSSLARAFGIVGAAGLVRYRAKIEDPKDAGVMLSTLSVGLATGVGLWMIAIVGTVFLLALLWTVESFEPPAVRVLIVKVRAKDTQPIKAGIEQWLRRQGARFDVMGLSTEELEYRVRWPADRPSNRLSERLSDVGPAEGLQVEVEDQDR